MCVFFWCRLLELNSRLLCGFDADDLDRLISSLNGDDKLCRLVVLRETVECSRESNSLSQDISHWRVLCIYEA